MKRHDHDPWSISSTDPLIRTLAVRLAAARTPSFSTPPLLLIVSIYILYVYIEL